MYVILVGDPDDPHCIAVHNELAQRGHTSRNWFMSDYPRRKRLSLSVLPEVLLQSDNEVGQLSGSDVVWLRKRTLPSLPDDLNSEARDFITRECTSMLEGVLQIMEQSSRMVNKASSSRIASYKSYQIAVASKLGISTPKTLISNDPDRIVEFWDLCDRRVVFKPLTRSSVVYGGKKLMLPTSRLTSDVLDDRMALAGSAGIYQEEIPKMAEVRLFCFGEDAEAFQWEIRGLANPDWRASFATNAPHIIEIPDFIRVFTKHFLSELALETASFDFAIDPQSCWHFLEANDAGNFIHLANTFPDRHVVPRFVDFLTSRKVGGAMGALS